MALLTTAQGNRIYLPADKLDEVQWKVMEYPTTDEVLYSARLVDGGILTILDRMTGFGWRDTETGYRDIANRFWLASGDADVRLSGTSTLSDAIAWVKSRANTCVGV